MIETFQKDAHKKEAIIIDYNSLKIVLISVFLY